MLKSESQMCVRYGSAVEGEYWSIRLKQRVIDDVQLRAGGNFNISEYEVGVNFYFMISSDRPLFAIFSQVSSVVMPASLLLQLAEKHQK